MDPSPSKRSKPDFRQLNDEDSACMRKLSAQVEKHLKLKNQLLRETQEELHDIKQIAVRETSLRVCVKRIGLTVSIDQLKVRDLNFCLSTQFFNLVFFKLG
jgi:hypothetical protein